MKVHLIILLYTLIYTNLSGQSVPAHIQEEYDKNISMTHINDVYIPIDVSDAMRILDEMSSDASKDKIKSGDHAVVVQNLSRGLGKWMIINWNFYTGSRLSHALRQLGVTHPDDMATYLVETYYRHLMDQEYELEQRAKEIYARRKKEQENRNKRKVVIKQGKK